MPLTVTMTSGFPAGLIMPVLMFLVMVMLSERQNFSRWTPALHNTMMKGVFPYTTNL